MNDHQFAFALEALRVFLWGLLFAAGLFNGAVLIALGVDFYKMHSERYAGRRRMKSNKISDFAPAVDGQTVVFELNQLRSRRQKERDDFFKNAQEML